MLAPPIAPMLARPAPSIPTGSFLYEPKWDGFRCLAFAGPGAVHLQSRDERPLGRYFPELEEAIPRILPRPAVLDGEIVIMGSRGLDFDALQARLHPAASRVRMLAAATPAAFVAFDMLADGDSDLRRLPFRERRQRLSDLLTGVAPPLHITPATADPAVAGDWFTRFEGAGFDGIVAKPLDGVYEPGVRAMTKVKHLRTADCVVGGFRWYKDAEGVAVGSLLLGLYDGAGVLHHVGHTSSFSAAERKELAHRLRPLMTGDGSLGFGAGRTPGAPSRWSQGRDASWERLRPELVCEVTYDHLQGARLRHAATFKRWRADKPARDCGFDQLEAVVPFELASVFAG